jgi:hypothetical protein
MQVENELPAQDNDGTRLDALRLLVRSIQQFTPQLFCWENTDRRGKVLRQRRRRNLGENDDIPYQDEMGSTFLSRFYLLNELVSDYNCFLGAGNETEQIKVYDLVPDAAKQADRDQQFVHFSFTSMLSCFWEYTYNTKYTNKYKVTTEDHTQKEDFKQGTYTAALRLIESVFNINSDAIRLKQNENTPENERRLKIKSVSISQTRVNFIYEHGWKYDELLPQDTLTEELVRALAQAAPGSKDYKVLLYYLMKSLVIGGDTGKRSTFTLCYNFALSIWEGDTDELAEFRKLQAQSVMDFKFATHKNLKHEVRNHDLVSMCSKHFERQMQQQFFLYGQRR